MFTLHIHRYSLFSLPCFVQLGEIVKITKEGVRSVCVVPRPDDKLSAFCIFEYVYFARPDSVFEGALENLSTCMI